MQLIAFSSSRARCALAAAGVTLALASVARAEDSFTAKTQIYTDSDHTTVVSPLAAISRDAWKDGTLSASFWPSRR